MGREINNIPSTIKGSELPEITKLDGVTILGYEESGAKKTSGRINLVKAVNPVITEAVSNKADKTRGSATVVYSDEIATKVTEENRNKIASIGSILDYLTLGQFILTEDDTWTFAVGYENADGDRIIQLGIRYDGWIYPVHDLMGERALTPMSDDIWQLALTYANGQVISGIKKTGEIYKTKYNYGIFFKYRGTSPTDRGVRPKTRSLELRD